MGVKEFAIKFIIAVVVTAAGLFWSGVVIIGLAFTCLRKGFRNAFQWKDRRKLPPPFHYCAWDEETRNSPGLSTKPWNHAYVTVPETGMRFHYVYSGKVPGHLAVSDVDGETVTLPSDDDTNATNTPKLMICVHGCPENWFSWRHILRYFDDASPDVGNYFVVALDMRGYGDSEITDGYKSYHVNHLVNDIKGVAKALGYEKIVLVGHDWGGLVTWEVAKTYPDFTEKVIVMNAPMKSAFLDILKQKPAQLLKSWYVFFFQIPYLPEAVLRLWDYKNIEAALNGKRSGIRKPENRLTQEEVEVFKYSFRHSTTGPINYYRALLWPFAEPGPSLRYPKIEDEGDSLRRVPVLLIWGDADSFLINDIAEDLRKYLNISIGSKLAYVKGASHWVQQDRPREVIRHMIDFLR